MKANSTYFDQVVSQLRQDARIRALGFRDGETDIRWYGKGADHHDLMVITKPTWTIASDLGKAEGYDGVNVHFESRQYGSFQVDCELTPRLGSEKDKNQAILAPLLQLKGAVTKQLRDALLSELKAFQVNAKRVRRDPADPQSLKVVGFDLNLPAGHSGEKFASSILPIMIAAAPLIERVVLTHRSTDHRPAEAPVILPGTVPDRGPCVLPPIPKAAAFLARINKTRGMPERNMEDLVKQFLMLLGHDEDNIRFQIGRMDICVAGPDEQPSMVIEAKRLLQPKNQRGATDQAFGYAERTNTPLVVVTDADTYEIHDRRRGSEREATFVGRFQLTRFHSDDEVVLDKLRPELLECRACRNLIPCSARFCPRCGNPSA